MRYTAVVATAAGIGVGPDLGRPRARTTAGPPIARKRPVEQPELARKSPARVHAALWPPWAYYIYKPCMPGRRLLGKAGDRRRGPGSPHRPTVEASPRRESNP